MVDVGEKPISRRHAVAEAWILLSDSTLDLIGGGSVKKGDVIQIAQIAGISAAKQTSNLIPLCHPLPIDGVDVQIELHPGRGLRISADVRTHWRTGVEMEAMTSVSAAALTVYDMIKAVERGAEIQKIRLLHKSGGKSGNWNNENIVL